MKQSYIICGRSGAGKGTVSHILEGETGGNIFRLSSIPEKFLKEFDIVETRGNYAKMSGLLRSTFGEDIFLRAVERYIENTDDEVIIFDGPRKMNVIERIRELSDATIIYIETPPEKRYERIHTRGEKHDEGSLTLEQFLAQEELDTEKELEAIRDMADIVIENNGTREELIGNIAHVLNISIS